MREVSRETTDTANSVSFFDADRSISEASLSLSNLRNAALSLQNQTNTNFVIVQTSSE